MSIRSRVLAPLGALLVMSLATLPALAAPFVETFDNPINIGASQAPGVWYTDRYAPATFTSPVAFDGRQTLLHGISVNDGGSSRPVGFGSAFYDTQGRKFDLAGGTASMSIELYVPSDWGTSGRRMAGFWGTAFDAGNAVSAFPIIEFTSDGGVPRFRGWDSGVWVDLGLPTGFAYDEWYTLMIELIGGQFKYSVGDLSAFVNAFGSTNIGNVILQGHNTTAGVTYDIHWDNLNAPAAAVPEPASLAVWSLAGIAGLCGAWRRRKAGAA